MQSARTAPGAKHTRSGNRNRIAPRCYFRYLLRFLRGKQICALAHLQAQLVTTTTHLSECPIFGPGAPTVVRPSSVAVLRSNAQILELMAAQLEELAIRTNDRDEAAQLRRIAARTRLLCGEYQDSAGYERSGTAA